ncbi:hypothetical protein SEA_WEASELS2_24 [Rhodococcus phage Weasels2]|uniref:Uncharacterized protein n=1 Tax=Rhodococcus phage Weasels2 TaxID=1897437 RepID=A0A1I9SA08_9CAUD|nr:hypothetical protein FDH04_gp024 [Rhodococcus phage Weasels2]AOZ63614.1 hypothetical protein SEA_WEASELS2_24 [Rhodococcus phage Weasels2]
MNDRQTKLYYDLDEVPPHVAFSCFINGNKEDLKLSYNEPDVYEYLDEDDTWIAGDFLAEYGPFLVTLDNDSTLD